MSEIKLIEYEIFDNDNILLVFSGMENYCGNKLIGEIVIAELTNRKYINLTRDYGMNFFYRGENKIHINNIGDLKISNRRIIYSYAKRTYVMIPNDLISSTITKLGLIINEINKNHDIIDLINKTFNIGD